MTTKKKVDEVCTYCGKAKSNHSTETSACPIIHKRSKVCVPTFSTTCVFSPVAGVTKEWVIRYTGAIGKSVNNNGDYYESTGFNGMWNYHRWVTEDKAKVFTSKDKAQGYKDAHAKSSRIAVSVPIHGRVVLKSKEKQNG